MTLPLHFAAFADHLVGRGTIATFSPASTSTSGGRFYFEAQGKTFNSNMEVFLGIADASFVLANPIQFDVAPPQGAHCAGLTFKTSGQVPVGWGSPSNIPTVGSSTVATNDWIGMVVDTILGALWWRNATASPSTWWGKGSGAPDPVTGTDGFDFSGNVTAGAILYVLAGAGNEATPGTNDILFNFGATSFAATCPTNCTAWGATATTTLNPSDKDSHITLAGSNLEITATSAISGSNQPTAFVRSTTYKERA